MAAPASVAPGDVAALRGTKVRLLVHPTVKVPGGVLRVEGAEPVPLELDDTIEEGPGGTLHATLTVSEDSFYRIDLEGFDGTLRAASPDYAITVLEDQPPAVSFVKPGRDSKVSPIEEVFAEIKAEDDFGVARLELVYSVNGAAEQTLALHRGAARKFVSAGHTFFLEEMGLQTGDFVSYYARARDAGLPGQTATTDIYFLEARPFRRDYRQAEQGGMPGGGGGQRDGALSQQQRQIIAATFKLVRDRARLGDKEAGEDLATIALVQGRLREQAETLLTRMSTRGILERLPGGIASKVGEAFGAVAVSVPAPKVYETLSSKVAEAVFMPMETHKSFRLHEVTKFVTTFKGNLYDGSFAIVMNPKKFESLSKEDQAALMAVSGEKLSGYAGSKWAAADKVGYEQAKTSGTKVSEASAEMLKQLGEVAAKLEADWLKAAAGKGFDPKAALDELRAIARSLDKKS